MPNISQTVKPQLTPTGFYISLVVLPFLWALNEGNAGSDMLMLFFVGPFLLVYLSISILAIWLCKERPFLAGAIGLVAPHFVWMGLLLMQ